MWDLNLNFNKNFLALCMSVVFVSIPLWGGEEAKDPLKNNAFFLIQKELIRKSETQKEWSKKDEKEYKGWLFLEGYFLNKGVSLWSMKVLHRIIQMRENVLVEDDPRKAFLDCEAWRVLDYDLKNNEKKELIQELIEKKNFSKKDYFTARNHMSYKVARCTEYITPNWTWIGPPYSETPYDIKAKNAIRSLATYLKIKKVTSSP